MTFVYIPLVIGQASNGTNKIVWSIQGAFANWRAYDDIHSMTLISESRIFCSKVYMPEPSNRM